LSQLSLAAGDQLPLVTAPLLPVPARPGRDLTADFKAVWNTVDRDLGADKIAELRGYKVILVPGFLSNAATRPVNIFGMQVELGRYFGEQMSTLEGLGVEYKLSAIESEETPAYNAKIIAADIEASDKPVLLLAHSKGGLDIMEALITRKDLLPKVKGIITIQTPYFGSPIADYILDGSVLGRLAARLLKSMGGTIDSLSSLDTRKRQAYYRDNFAAINEVVNTVPILTFGTWKDNVAYRLDTVLKPLRNAMLQMGFPNDGEVPVYSTILPGADFVKLEGVDHFVSVMRTGPILQYDRPRLTKTLLLLFLTDKHAK